MKYSKVFIEAFGYELAPDVVSSAEIEERLAPVYATLRMHAGQLEAMTGIVERRFWPVGSSVARGAAAAGIHALKRSPVPASEIDVLLYTGVCREGFEPATACDVAAYLREAGQLLPETAVIHDLGSACLGALTGMLDLANRIELGQVRAGMVVSCESSREIVDLAIHRMREQPNADLFRLSIATLTGGSGAVAIVMSDGSFDTTVPRRRLVGGVQRSAPQFHRLCRWGMERRGGDGDNTHREFMVTDSVAVLEHGTALGQVTWEAFLPELGWEKTDRVICHQVGRSHREAILRMLDIDESTDFVAYDFLGNTGSVALPLAAALAEERDFLCAGQRVGFLGIGSGLNCMMLGVEW